MQVSCKDVETLLRACQTRKGRKGEGSLCRGSNDEVDGDVDEDFC